jgi:hypothetical protein
MKLGHTQTEPSTKYSIALLIYVWFDSYRALPSMAEPRDTERIITISVSVRGNIN